MDVNVNLHERQAHCIWGNRKQKTREEIDDNAVVGLAHKP